MPEGFYTQSDPRWSAAQTKKNANGIRVCGERFLKAIDDYVDSKPGRRRDETIGESGCWHVSIANLLRSLSVNLHGVSSDPVAVVKELRKQFLYSLTGYCFNPPFDVVSAITNARVQMVGYRDYRRRGALLTERHLHDLLAMVSGPKRRAIANVQAHERYSDNSHYVLIIGRSGNDFEIQDPGWPENTRLRTSPYSRVYQLCMYERQ